MRWSHFCGLLTDSFEQSDERSIDEIFFEKYLAGFTTFGFTDDFHEIKDLGLMNISQLSDHSIRLACLSFTAYKV